MNGSELSQLLAEALFNNSHLFEPSAPTTGPHFYTPPVTQEELERRAKFQAFVLDLFAQAAERAKRPLSPLRIVVEADQWHIPVDSAGKPKLVSAKRGEHRGARLRPWEPEPEAALWPKGDGGHLLPVYLYAPESQTDAKPCQVVDGRTLARHLPDELDGLLLHFAPEAPPQELSRGHFATLREMVAGLDYEACLLDPAPGQVETLLNGTLYVERRGKKGGLPSSPADVGWSVWAYTHPQLASHAGDDPDLVAMPARELFARFMKEDELDSIQFNLDNREERGKVHSIYFSPAEVHHLLQGRDTRINANPPIVRSRYELDTWHGICLRGAMENRELRVYEEKDEDGRHLIRIKWRSYGSDARDQFTPWLVLLPEAEGQKAADLPSQVICPGEAIMMLNAGDINKRAPAALYDPGKVWFGKLMQVKADDIEIAKRREYMASLVLSCLPKGVSKVPRSAMLTRHGAKNLREHPHANNRGWLEASLATARRFTKAWAWL